MDSNTDYQDAEQMLLNSILAGETNVENRTTLGPTVPIKLFQVLRLIAMGSSMENMVGVGSRALVYQSGQRVGELLGGGVAPQAGKSLETYVGLVQQVCKQLSIGLVVPTRVKLDIGELSLRVDECVSCAGINGVTAPICHFEAGLVGGIVKAFVGRNVKASESKCNAIGDSTCLIDVKIL